MLKRKLLAVAVTGVISSGAMASSFHNQGSVLGYGDAGNNHTMFSNFKNPAFLAGDATNREVGLGLSVGIDAEFFGVDGVGDNFDALQLGIDQVTLNVENGTYLLNAGLDPAVAQAAAEADASAVVNDFFAKNEALKIALKASGSLPLVVQTTSFGGYMVAASVTTGTTVNMIRYGDSIVTADIPLQTLTVDTNNAMVFSAFAMSELSLGYSADLNRFFKPQNAQINAGIRFKSMTAQFNHYGLGFDDILNNTADDFGNQISNGLEEVTTFENTDTQMGVDLGLQYIAKNFLLGLSVENVNSPTFNYNVVNALTIAPEVSSVLTKDITFEPKARLEAATYSQNRRWTFAGFADLTKTLDITGLETQKAGVSASYASNRWFLPDLRVGYTKEAAGNKMSRMHGGVTLGFLSVDVAANSFEFGEDVENSLAANVSVEFSF